MIEKIEDVSRQITELIEKITIKDFLEIENLSDFVEDLEEFLNKRAGGSYVN